MLSSAKHGRELQSDTLSSSPLVLTRDHHHVSRKQLSPNALKVLYRLKDAGYDAYLVGGCIRDILLGYEPKDFDVVTNATPEQVKEAFSNSRLIGRRFKLVHVTFGREIIEVATFRANHQQQHGQQRGASKKTKKARHKNAKNKQNSQFIALGLEHATCSERRWCLATFCQTCSFYTESPRSG